MKFDNLLAMELILIPGHWPEKDLTKRVSESKRSEMWACKAAFLSEEHII